MKKTILKNNLLGVFANGSKVYLLTHSKKGDNDYYFLDSSDDGLKFEEARKNFFITRDDGALEKLSYASNFKISEIPSHKYALIYKSSRLRSQIFVSTSTNLSHWIGSKKVSGLTETSVIVPEYKFNGKYVSYTGEKDISIAYSEDLTTWDVKKEPLLARRGDNFDSDNIIIANVRLNPDGILLFYFSKKEDSGKWYMGTALFDRENPENIIYRGKESLWEEEETFLQKEISPVGAIVFRGKLLVYFAANDGKLYVFGLNFYKQSPAFSKPFPSFLVKKFKDNPIISPIIHHFWESKATFNPAAIYEGGKVHILYRAVGDSDSSVMGYASSNDGLNIDERLEEPVYVPKEDFECGDSSKVVFKVPYMSGGGGNGGCEDARLTVIGDKIYMTYVAFNGRSYPSVALTSIKTEDFLNQKWDWEKPVRISEPNEMHKNWVLFPEEIDGKFAILHSISPDISISYFENLSELDGDKYIKSYWGRNAQRYFWDNHVRGPGPPPIKTELGWLLLYHAMDFRDPDKYKVGAMILDKENPTKVLYRSRSPVLEPDRHYENEGYKAGVVYSCGAVIKNKNLFIYYGGADKVVCVAKTDLKHFLGEIERSEEPEFTSVPLYAQI